MVDVTNIVEITKLNAIRSKIIAAIADVKHQESVFGGTDATAPAGFNIGHNLFIRKYSSRLTPSIDLSGCYIGAEMMKSTLAALEAKKLSVEARLLVLGVSTTPTIVPLELGANVQMDVSMPRFVRLASGGSVAIPTVYTSSNVNIASVDAPSGVVTMHAVGTVTITAAQGTNTDSYTLTIHPAFEVGGKVTRAKGMTFELPAITGGSGTRRFTSSSVDTATVDQTSGEITAVASGTTTITVVDTLTGNSKTVELVILEGITTPAVNMVLSDTHTMAITGGSNSYTFTSADLSIATVDAVTGVVTGAGYGTTTINVRDTMTGEVKAIVVNVGMVIPDVTLAQSATFQIVVENGGGLYTYASADDTIATVSSTGLVTGVLAGTTTINVTSTSSGQVKTINVTVTA